MNTTQKKRMKFHSTPVMNLTSIFTTGVKGQTALDNKNQSVQKRPMPNAIEEQAQVLISEGNFDAQADWQTQDEDDMGNIPTGWDTGRTDENWHPANTPGSSLSMLNSGNNPEQVYGGTGKSFVTYPGSFNDLSNNGFTSDGFITKDITPTDELYVEFQIKLQPGFAADTEGGSIKILPSFLYCN